MMHIETSLFRFAHASPALVLIFLTGAITGQAAAQQVHVFGGGQAQEGNTIVKSTTSDDTARLLVIPVVTTDSPFDPNNNDVDGYNPLNPNLHQDIIDRFEETNDFWLDASYNHVGAEVTVLNRYYQMPREEDFYVNPAYQPVRSTGSMLTFPAAVPVGQFKFEVHVRDSDATTYTIEFEAGDGPFSAADLVTHINDEISSNPSFDKVDTSITGNALRFQMGQRHVRAGSYVRISQSGSDADVLEALGLNTPELDLATAEITSKGEEFPVAAAAASTLTLRIQYEGGATEDVTWNIPGGSNFADAAAFVAAHGGDVPSATIAVSGDELQFDLTPGQPDPIENIIAIETGPWTLDELGLDRVIEQIGLVTAAGTNTVKGDRRLIAGQAVAAFMMNELIRVEGGADPIPNIDFIAANEAQLTQAFQQNVDYAGVPAQPYNSYVVMFLDITGKREGASGGFIDAGVDNGGYLFTHQSHGNIQIIYQSTSSGTIAHETGHNYGFPDIYNNGGGNYDPNLLYANNYDIMDSSTLNHPGAWIKSVDSNWVALDGGSIEVFPMPAMPGLETRKIAITPLDYSTADYDSVLAGLPGDLDATAKVVRLPIGFDAASTHHFLLLQNRQRSQNFSQTIPMAPGVANRGGLYLTDTITDKVFDYFKITSRNYVHPLTDRPLLVPGSNAQPILDAAPATDIAVNMTYPAYAGLTIDIVDTIPGPAGAVDRPTYIVEISREQSDFLDLAVNPWGAPPYESTDIWIEHGDKAEADLSAVPLAGNGEPARWSDTYDPDAPGNDGKPLNWIRVKITNNGTVDATDVQLKVKVNSPGAMGASGTWVELDLSVPLDVPAGGSTIFSVPWNPAVKGHTCVQVEIFRWSSALGDIDLTNNGTQENVNDFRPTAGSGWHPTPFSVDVTNPFDRELEISLNVEGLRPGFSVEWDETYFVMPPHSKTRRKGVMHIDENIIPTPEPDGSGGIIFYECDPETMTTAAAVLDNAEVRCDKRRTKQPIRMFMHVIGYANAGDFRVPIGGVTYNVQPTLETDIDVRVFGRDGFVRVEGETHPKAAGQDMEIEVQYPSGRFVWIAVRTDNNGRFVETFDPAEDGKVRIAVNYPDGGDFAPVKVEGQLYDPEASDWGGDFPGFLPCASCEAQSLYWLLNFILLILILLLVFRIWFAMVRRKP